MKSSKCQMTITYKQEQMQEINGSKYFFLFKKSEVYQIWKCRTQEKYKIIKKKFSYTHS